MRILITGGTGFVGQNLIPRILTESSDDKLMLLCRDVSAASKKLNIGGNQLVHVISSEDWNKVIAFNPDVVIHLAAYSTSANNYEAAERLISSNIIYGTNLLIALSECPALKLFVNTGSFAEYRKGPRKIDNSYLYSATKSAFRPILNYYANLRGFKYVTAVPYSVYGGIPTVKRIMDYMIEAKDAKTPVDMTPGEQILDFIHVDDIVEFYMAVINKFDKFLDLEQGYEFHLGTGRGYTLREVSQMLESIIGHPLNIRWGGRPYRERDTMYAVAPISYNREEKLWESNIELREGLTKFVQQYNDITES